MTEPIARIAVIGGSGLYSLFDPAASEKRRIETPYGPADVTVGELGGRTVAFLTRHGVNHSVAPHLINYRANIWALASLGVKAILSSAAVGGVSPDYAPGSLVLTDQYIDRTHGRADTFFDLVSVQHLGSADPFDPVLHAIAADALQSAGETVIHEGTVVVIQGPRFSTRAESLWFRAAGAHTVNMTLYPEVPLAAELGIGTVNLSYVTDSDAGVSADEKQGEVLSAELVFSRLKEAQPRIVAAIETIIRAIPDEYAGRDLIDPAEVAKVLNQ
ncbi:5'-methylthioadenosine phosphorylase [Conyzicola lurida]|uniref:S-methyl-5'-thioadenosine phosphorylase n=1 Tax=Conyzicola lurida TaxID=1172621 RepID=A0A841AKK0_9MICO|nr:MTAP family purine nucleoside phosphorylase [Conyzicola lurida]MBB5842241.1 5'-methylthioadenosine phosphorylase [Conyzicola lurida]